MVVYDWRECAQAMYTLAGRSRFSWPQEGSGGFNCSPDFTISDLTGALRWLWTFPGDLILTIKPLHQFFEIQGPAVGHLFSYVFGFFFFPVAFMLILYAAVAALMSVSDTFGRAKVVISKVPNPTNESIGTDARVEPPSLVKRK